MSDIDVQNQREVDSILGDIVATHRDLVRRDEEWIRAAEAFLTEVERDRYSARLRPLRDATEKARDAVGYTSARQGLNLEHLHSVLGRWKRPGRDYADFIKKARDAHGYYHDAYTESMSREVRVMNEIWAIDDAATRRR